MSGVHLYRTEADAEDFASLFEALRDAGLRFGWLELDDVEPPEVLQRATGLGALRAVAAGGLGTTAVKSPRRRLVLKDLIREHFKGCDLVLIRGAAEVPSLAPEASGWVVRRPDGSEERLDSTVLVRSLRRPGSALRSI